MSRSREYRFDGWMLCAATGELCRDGRRLRLQQHPAVILEALLASPGELVSRDALIERLWPKGVVEFDTALNTAVHRLRVALGDSADAPRYIETIPRRGYRFVGQLEQPTAVAGAGAAARERAGADVDVGGRWMHGRRHRFGWLTLSLGTAAVAVAVWLGGQRDPPPQTAQAAPAMPVHALEPLARADFLFQRRSPGDLERAQREYEAALAIDAGLAPAWAGLAGVHWVRTIVGAMPPDEGLARVQDAARRALALDPGLADAHLRLHNYLQAVGQTSLADEHLRKALALAPDSASTLGMAASLAARDGRWDEAIALQRRAVRAAPLSGLARHNLASLLLLAGQVPEAGHELRRLHDTVPPTDASRELEAMVSVLERRCDAALALAGDLSPPAARDQVRALALHCLGRTVAADEALQTLIRAHGDGDPLRIAETLAFRGEADAAFHWLNRGLTAIAPGTPPWLKPVERRAWMMRQSPLLSALRSDPRWSAWLDALQLAHRAARPSVRGG